MFNIYVDTGYNRVIQRHTKSTMIKGKWLVEVVVMEKCCKGAAEEERVSVWWWVASVEVELEASALEERGAAAAEDKLEVSALEERG